MRNTSGLRHTCNVKNFKEISKRINSVQPHSCIMHLFFMSTSVISYLLLYDLCGKGLNLARRKNVSESLNISKHCKLKVCILNILCFNSLT